MSCISSLSKNLKEIKIKRNRKIKLKKIDKRKENQNKI